MDSVLYGSVAHQCSSYVPIAEHGSACLSGEIACTYASGCCTREQAMLIAYHRGRLPIEHGITTGLMAATGLSAEQAIERCQGTNVVLACDNSPSSTTVSGTTPPLPCRAVWTL